MAPLQRGGAIRASQYTVLLALRPAPPGHRLSATIMAPTFVREDITPPIRQRTALRIMALPRGKVIPASLSTALVDLQPTPPGPKPWLEPTALTFVRQVITHLPVLP